MACLRPTPNRRFSCPGNARLTFHGRLLIVERHRGGMPKSHIAAAMGVSRKCVKKWIDRYDAEGLTGLHDRSSRPHTMPTRTSPHVQASVVAARAEHREGPDTLGPKVAVPARTVSRILRRHHVPYLRELDPMTGEVIRSSKQTAVRYEREHPGELVHMDVKKLGRIPDGGGWRVHGRQIPRDRATVRVSTSFIPSSTTTPGWPTARSCQTRRAPRAPGSSNAPSATSPPMASPTSSG